MKIEQLEKLNEERTGGVWRAYKGERDSDNYSLQIDANHTIGWPNDNRFIAMWTEIEGGEDAR